MKTHGEWRYSSTIVDLGRSCKWGVTFTHRSFYPRGNRPRFPLARRLGGPQIRSVEKRKSFSCRESNLAVQPVACRCTDWAIPPPLFFKIYGINRRWVWMKLIVNLKLQIWVPYFSFQSRLNCECSLLFRSTSCVRACSRLFICVWAPSHRRACTWTAFVLSRLGVTYKTGFGFIAPYTFTQLGTTGNITLSLFCTLSSSHMKSFCTAQFRFLPLLCSCQFRRPDSIRF
jgi:hypothetical protein